MMANENTQRIAWYVMIHMNPNWIEQMLQPEFASNQVYLPYLNMPHIAVDHTADDKEDDRQYNPTGDDFACIIIVIPQARQLLFPMPRCVASSRPFRTIT